MYAIIKWSGIGASNADQLGAKVGHLLSGWRFEPWLLLLACSSALEEDATL